MWLKLYERAVSGGKTYRFNNYISPLFFLRWKRKFGQFSTVIVNVISTAQIMGYGGGGGGVFPPPTTYRHPWDYNRTTCVIPP